MLRTCGASRFGASGRRIPHPAPLVHITSAPRPLSSPPAAAPRFRPGPRARRTPSSPGRQARPTPSSRAAPCRGHCAPSGRRAPSLRHPVASTPLHHVHRTPGFHPDPPAPVPVARASDALHRRSTRASTLLLVRPFVLPLLRPLLTSRSVSPRRPFSHEARSPQVRTRSFTAQPPDLRHLALTTRASQNVACSPCSASPHIQFLSIGSRLRSTLPPHTQSPSCSCASLRLLWPTYGRTSTSKIAPMLGAHNRLLSYARPAAGLAPESRNVSRRRTLCTSTLNHIISLP